MIFSNEMNVPIANPCVDQDDLHSGKMRLRSPLSFQLPLPLRLVRCIIFAFAFMATIDSTLGVIEVAVVFGSLYVGSSIAIHAYCRSLSGLATLQVYRYFRSYARDAWYIKSMVSNPFAFARCG